MKAFCTGFLSVLKRELRGYFTTPVAYVFLVIFLFSAPFLTFQKGFFDARQASLQLFFDSLPLLFIFLVPAIAMRLWAEERKSNSIMLLFTLPITTTQAVLGKYFAALSVLVLALFLTFPMVVTVAYLGKPDCGPIVGGYLASIMLAACFLAIGSFFSAITKNQVIAFILSVVACAVCLYAGSPQAMGLVAQSVSKGGAEIMESLSFFVHFDGLRRGVLEIRNILFFVIVTAGWLWGNLILLEQRRAAR